MMCSQRLNHRIDDRQIIRQNLTDLHILHTVSVPAKDQRLLLFQRLDHFYPRIMPTAFKFSAEKGIHHIQRQPLADHPHTQ